MKKDSVLVKENTSNPAPWTRVELEAVMLFAFDDMEYIEGECASRVRFDFRDGTSVWFNSRDVEGTLRKTRKHKIQAVARRYQLTNKVRFI